MCEDSDVCEGSDVKVRGKEYIQVCTGVFDEGDHQVFDPPPRFA